MQADTTTNPENMQALNPDEAAASLGFANTIMQQMMQQEAQAQEAPQEPQEAPEQAKPTIRDKYPKKEESGDLGQIKDDIEQIKQQISEALKEDDEQDKAETTTEEA